MSQSAPRNISKTVFKKAWTLAMTAFLLRSRREGRTLRWVAKALAMPFEQVRQKAIAMGLVLTTAYQTRVPFVQHDDEPAPLGPRCEILAEGCRWIGDDVSDSDWRMCGHPVTANSAWCAHHRRRVFWVGPLSQRDAA